MLVDSHCHLDFNDFEEDFDEILERARASDVRTEAEAAAVVACDFSGTEEGLKAYWPLTLNVGSEITDMTGRHVAKMTDVKWTDPE